MTKLTWTEPTIDILDILQQTLKPTGGGDMDTPLGLSA